MPWKIETPAADVPTATGWKIEPAPAEKPQSWGTTLAEVPLRAFAGFADMFGNAPTNVANLAKAGYGLVTGKPQEMTPDPNYVTNAMQRTGAWQGIPGPHLSTAPMSPTQAEVSKYAQAAALGATGGEASIPSVLRGAALGAGSQAAADVAHEVAPNSNIAPILAGIAVPEVGARVGARIAPALQTAVTPSLRAARAVSGIVGEETMGKLAQAKQGSPIGGIQQTTAQVVPSPQMSAIESWARSESHKGLFTTLDESNRKVIEDVLTKVANGKEDASTVAERVNKLLTRGKAMRAMSVEKRQAIAQQAQQLAEQAHEALNNRFSPSGNGAAQFGQAVQDSVHKAKQAAQAELDAKTAPLRDEAMQAGQAVNLTPVVDHLQELIKKHAGHDEVVNALTKRLRSLDIFNVQDTGHFSDMERAYNVRKSINDAIEGKTQDATDMLAKRQLLSVREQLDNAMNAASGGKWGQYLKAYATGARALDVFDAEHVGPIGQRNQYNSAFENSPLNAASRAFQPGAKGLEAANQLQKAGGMTPDVVSSVRGHVADMLNGMKGPDGRISVAKLHSFVQKYGPALKKFGMYDELSSQSKAIQFAEDHAASTQQEADWYAKKATGADVRAENSALGKLMNGADPQKVVASILASPKAATTLSKLVSAVKGDPFALNGLRRAVVGDIFKSTDARGITQSIGQQLKSFRDLRGALEKSGLYDAHQLDTMDNVFKQLQAESYAKAGAALGEKKIATKFNNMTNWFGNNAYAHVLRLLSIPLGYHFGHGWGAGVVSLGGTQALETAVQTATKNALIRFAYDPDFAAALTRKYTALRAKAAQPALDALSQNIAQELMVQGTAQQRVKSLQDKTQRQPQ